MCSYRLPIFKEGHVVPTEGTHKQNCSDIIETLDPLSTLWPLPTYIHHPAEEQHWYIYIADIWQITNKVLCIHENFRSNNNDVDEFTVSWPYCSFKNWKSQLSQIRHNASRPNLYVSLPTRNEVSMMPVVWTRDRSTSSTVGTYPSGFKIRCMCSK